MSDLRTDHDPNHPLTRALRETVLRNSLRGGVLLTFTSDSVGVNSSSPSPEFGAIMERLADAILFAFDRGDFDHALSHDTDPAGQQPSKAEAAGGTAAGTPREAE